MTQAQEYRLLARLEAVFDCLVEQAEALVDAWRLSNAEGWALDSPQVDAAWLYRALLDFWYQDGQDGRSTRSYIGVLAANEAVMEKLERVNSTKRAFAELLAEIRREVPSLIPEIKAVLPFRHPALHDHLRGVGLARLHLKQCWRAIPAAAAEVARIRLTWYASGRSIKRLSVQDAERMLLALDSEADHIRIQLRTLAGLPDYEPLAQVQAQAPLMRANLFFREPLDDGHSRQVKNIALPLFVPTTNGRLPNINQPPLHPPERRTRAKRSDARIEETPLLPSLRVYRYRDG
ncbi:DNA replication terminus site-binding protein [Halomonas eurihalina]|uniref:DNA replication terminus site-binding protein n=1 Tax=Halomonas eurihalina TaxID=42566 RepID=A0A5D9D779_HALER|nr:DNA replication terminus site-binding protein [Halomonas eurihalina]MDR5858771.1 DNA replication terminus site-binding protein [Halomonas eurihalina]TZG38910.1 DNA replication terminus site-binding protein [Halomonas eurihalina]